MKRKKTKIVWRPQKAIIELETPKGKNRYLSIRKPIVEEIDFTKRKDQRTIARTRELKAVATADDPFIITIYANENPIKVNVFRARELMAFMTKICWYLGVFGKISKNARRIQRELVKIITCKRKKKYEDNP